MPLTDNGLELLSTDECRRLLSEGDVGRVGVTIGALPAIFPVNYTLLGDDIVFTTGTGTKLQAAVDHVVVAFQVDHFDPSLRSGWSVLAVGMAIEITESDVLDAVRALGLQPFAPGQRAHVVRIRPEFVSGRRILMGGDPT